jgi:hypothetical protein
VQRDQEPGTDSDVRAPPPEAEVSERPLPGGDVTIDEMSDASFPASDPPATWTWEIRKPAADADESDDSERRSR